MIVMVYSQNSVPPNISAGSVTGHMVYNLAYTNILKAKETKHTDERSVRLFCALDIGLLG